MAVFADLLQEWPFDLQKRKMIKINELMIGSWVLVNGVPRQVADITEKEVGYYRKENSRKLYERLDKIEDKYLDGDIDKNDYTRMTNRVKQQMKTK